MKPREQRTPSWGRASATPVVAARELPQPFTVDQLHAHAGVNVSLAETREILATFVAAGMVTALDDGRYVARVTSLGLMLGHAPEAAPETFIGDVQ